MSACRTRALGVHLHTPDTVQHGEHDEAGGDGREEHLHHQEGAQLHLAQDGARLEDAGFLECDAEHRTHGQAQNNSGHDTISPSTCTAPRTSGRSPW
jgi:hypothetical protein